jgi:hypothetical protein
MQLQPGEMKAINLYIQGEETDAKTKIVPLAYLSFVMTQSRLQPQANNIAIGYSINNIVFFDLFSTDRSQKNTYPAIGVRVRTNSSKSTDTWVEWGGWERKGQGGWHWSTDEWSYSCDDATEWCYSLERFHKFSREKYQ